MREFHDSDRHAFVRYHQNAHYLKHYTADEMSADSLNQLFDRFLQWQVESPRQNWQLAVCLTSNPDQVIGTAGVRLEDQAAGTGEAGLDLDPTCWGRFRLALDILELLGELAFNRLELSRICGTTVEGNERVEKLLHHLGARPVSTHHEPGHQFTRRHWEIQANDWKRLSTEPI